MRRLAFPALLAALTACTAPFAPAAPEGASSKPAVSAVHFAASSDASWAMPRPARARLSAAVLENRRCEACHRDIAEEWESSLHHRADIEPSYRRAFAIEPLPFCRGCHAPEAVASVEEPEDVAALGVGCVTCHLTGDVGATLAVPSVEAARPAPHAVLREPRFGKVDACAGCHQFAFPGLRGKAPDELMQSTIAEHAASPQAQSKTCADCHMPRTSKGHRSHAFAASRDPDMLRSALQIRAVRTGATTVRITLVPNELGHAMPTGDLFRRIEVSAEAIGPEESLLGGQTRYLARHWEIRPKQARRHLVRDDRLGAEALDLEMNVGPEGQARDIVWRVAYQRVAHPSGLDSRDAEIDGEIVLAQGRLRP